MDIEVASGWDASCGKDSRGVKVLPRAAGFGLRVRRGHAGPSNLEAKRKGAPTYGACLRLEVLQHLAAVIDFASGQIARAARKAGRARTPGRVESKDDRAARGHVLMLARTRDRSGPSRERARP